MSAPATAIVQLCGDVCIRTSHRVVDPRAIGGPRCAEMLAYLVVHRHRDVGLDELASMMWAHTRPKSWNSAVRAVISKVRHTLDAASIPGEVLRSRSGYVHIGLPDSVAVDLDQIRARCRDGAESAEIRAERAQHAHRALSAPLLRGVKGAWADDLRLEFSALRVQALLDDAAASAQLGVHDRSVACAESAILVDPLSEIGYRHSVRGYLAMGDRAGALDAAARCRRSLAEELGVDPSGESETLFQRALAQEPVDAPGASPSNAGTLPALTGPIVGRDCELGIIAAAWAAAAQGTGQCVVVTGDAGTGKTTLVLEALRNAEEEGLDILYGRCSEDAIVAFEPFADAAVRELDARGPVGARTWLVDNGCDILRLVPGAATRFSDLMSSSPAGDDRSVVVAAVQQWLNAPSRSRPTIIVIDDVQWASSTTHAVLRYLLHASSSQATCFIITARTNCVRDREVNATLNTATRSGNVHRIALSEFGIDNVRRLVTDRCSALDPDALHRRTNGHPLFVTSLLDDRGALGDGPLPTSIVEFVQRIEHGLSGPARAVLQLCALIGGEIPRRVLRLACTEIDDIEFADAVDELGRARMLEQAGDASGRSDARPSALSDPAAELVPDDMVAMRHPLVQDVVYAGIGAGRRAELHSRVGHAFARWRTPAGVDDSARVARHFGRGLTLDRRLACAYAHLAGDHAYNVGGYEEAVTHYAQALQSGVVRDESSQRCRLLIGYGRALRAVRHPDARASALSALAMARRLGDRELQIDAVAASERHGMMFVQQYAPDTERVRIIDSIRTIFERTGHERTADYAIMLTQIVIERAWSDNYRYSAELAVRAADIARELGDGPLLARASVATLIGLRTPHGRELTSAALTDLDDLVDAREEVLGSVSTTIWLSRARLEHGDPIGARTALDAITPAQINGDPELGWLVAYGRMGIDLAAGRLRDCEDRLADIRAIPPSPTDHGYYGRLLPALTALRTMRGDLREIRTQSESMRSNFDLNPALRPALAVALIDAGDHEGAEDLLSWYTSDRLARIPVDPMWLSTFALIARAAADVSAAELCEQVYRHLSPHAECTVLTWASVYGVVHHHLAHLALGFGDVTRAAYHVADAVDAHGHRGYAAWKIESDCLALRIDIADKGMLDVDRVERIRIEAEAIGATAVIRRLDEFAARTL